MALQRAVRIAGMTALLVTTVSACGSTPLGRGPNATRFPVHSSSTLAATTTTVVSDQAKAMAALITLGDLPAGWTASTDPSPSTNTGQDTAISARMASCLGVRVDGSVNSWPTATSPTFASAEQADSLFDQVEVFPTAGVAAADFAQFSSPKFPGCFVQFFEETLKSSLAQALQPGQRLGSVSARASAFPPVGDHSGALRLTFVIINQSGLHASAFIDLILVIVGRSETTLVLTQPELFAVPNLGVQLARDAASRMTA
jgi:hypothetical protein